MANSQHSWRKTAQQLAFCLLLFFTFNSCQKKTWPEASLTLASGQKIRIYVSQTKEHQQKGLSDIKPEDWPKEEGMLFPQDKMDFRQFWMPDTYMSLHIYFLDGDMRVIDVAPHMPAHPSRVEPIPKTPVVFARHVLEMRSDAEANKLINVGDKLVIDRPELLKVLWEK